MNTDMEELSEFDEARLSRAFKSEFASVAYNGTSPKNSHRGPILFAAAVIAAAVVGTSVLATGGHSGAWAATPHALALAERNAAVSECRALAAGDLSKVHDPQFSVTLVDARGDSTFVALQGEVTAANATAEVPVGSRFSMGCLAIPGPDGKPLISRTGSLSIGPGAPDDSAMGVSDSSGTHYVAWGPVAAGAVSVELRAAGMPTTTATITDVHYALWWPKAVDGTIVELASDGSIVKSIPIKFAPPSKVG